MNNTIKKQNRILLIALVVVLTAVAVLIAVTGGANKRSEEKNPPLDSSVPESGTAETLPSEKEAEDVIKKGAETEQTTNSETMNQKDDTTEKAPTKPDTKDASADTEEVSPVVSVPKNVMPTMTLPLDAPVSKGFSGEVPVFSYTMNDYRTHGGVDFACADGTTVKAAADGTVCELYDDPMMGITVALQHDGGAVTRYKGLSEESLSLLSMGDSVKRGQPIGTSGSTSLIESAEEPHIHFELEVNGVKENPGDFLKLTYLSEITED